MVCCANYLIPIRSVIVCTEMMGSDELERVNNIKDATFFFITIYQGCNMTQLEQTMNTITNQSSPLQTRKKLQSRHSKYQYQENKCIKFKSIFQNEVFIVFTCALSQLQINTIFHKTAKMHELIN